MGPPRGGLADVKYVSDLVGWRSLYRAIDVPWVDGMDWLGKRKVGLGVAPGRGVGGIVVTMMIYRPDLGRGGNPDGRQLDR